MNTLLCMYKLFLPHKTLKGDLLCKNHFYKVFEHSCEARSVWKQPAFNGTNPPTHLFII